MLPRGDLIFLDPHEPENVGKAVAKLGLRHVVITSVDRDDLDDGGAQHFADTILAIRQLSPDTTIEVLTPDFLRKEGAVEIVVAARPDVFNHNMETVPRLYPTIRPGARYFHSLSILQKVKELDPTIFTKSGIMVGLGETDGEVGFLMDDLRSVDVDFMTIGQYLQPTPKHAVVNRFVEPAIFAQFAKIGAGKGIFADIINAFDPIQLSCRCRFCRIASGPKRCVSWRIGIGARKNDNP